MYHKLLAGEVYTLKSYHSNNWVKFIVSDIRTDNYGNIAKYYVYVLDHMNFNYDKNKTCILYRNSDLLHKDDNMLEHHKTATPLDKTAAHRLINHMLKHEAVKQDNKEWFHKLCNENKNLA